MPTSVHQSSNAGIHLACCHHPQAELWANTFFIQNPTSGENFSDKIPAPGT